MYTRIYIYVLWFCINGSVYRPYYCAPGRHPLCIGRRRRKHRPCNYFFHGCADKWSSAPVHLPPFCTPSHHPLTHPSFLALTLCLTFAHQKSDRIQSLCVNPLALPCVFFHCLSPWTGTMLVWPSLRKILTGMQLGTTPWIWRLFCLLQHKLHWYLTPFSLVAHRPGTHLDYHKKFVGVHKSIHAMVCIRSLPPCLSVWLRTDFFDAHYRRCGWLHDVHSCGHDNT